MNTLQTCLIATAATLTPALACAVPADPRPRTLHQPDGTAVTVRLVGDERSHFYLTPDNAPALRCADGWLRYAVAADGGDVTPGGIAVGCRTEAEARFIASETPAMTLAALNDRCEKAVTRRSPRRVDTLEGSYPTTGDRRGLVVLVEYQDVQFSIPDPQAEFTAMLNTPGYDGYGGTGSAADWFRDNSMGQFNPTFDVYGPVRLEKNMAWYGENGANGDDLRAHMMVVEACRQLEDEIDFSLYDEDADGVVDNVFVFYAGLGENLGGDASPDCVWPHSWDLSEVTAIPYMVDGLQLDHYACTNEIDLTGRMDGIGTFVHEFSHVLGLPDLYSTNYSYAFTPGSWSVLDAGPYNNDSRTPPCYSAFERQSLGWLSPTLLTGPANVALPHVAQNAACMVQTQADNEWFLFENRQQTGWDTYIPNHGMLVWHIDYNANVWHYNTVNDRKAHQYVDIEEADGIESDNNREGDCFPGSAGVTEFTDDTTPSMRTWDGTAQHMPVTGIRESNGFIYFKVCGGRPETMPVTALDAAEVASDSFTACWTEGDPGSTYTLSVYTVGGSADKPVIDYVPGWRDRDMAENLRAVVSGLEADTEYRYTVRAVDPSTGLQSVPSNEVCVTTLPPTFTSLTPLMLSVTATGDGTALAQWAEVAGADSYLLSVYTPSYGDELTEVADFTDGISAMPRGWATDSQMTYANAAYCGESAPSLRLNSDGQSLATALYPSAVRSLSFWHRGVGCGEGSAIEIEAWDGRAWTKTASIPVVNEAGGCTWSVAGIPLDMGWPASVSRLRLVFAPQGKGSVAIDDVNVGYGGESGRDYADGWQDREVGNVLEAGISGLRSDVVYMVTVTAVSGAERSHEAVPMRVLAQSGVNAPVAPCAMTVRVSGRDIIVEGAEGPVMLTTPSGMALGVSRSGFTVASPGLYILRSATAVAKVLVR